MHSRATKPSRRAPFARPTAGVNADLLPKGLLDFEAGFAALSRQEQVEALQCVLQGVTVTPDELPVEVFELAEFDPAGSQNRANWLPVVDACGTLVRDREPSWATLPLPELLQALVAA